MDSLEQNIKNAAHTIGFTNLGITNILEPPHYNHYLDWVNQGYQNNMWYLAEDSRKQKRKSLKTLLPSATSVLVGAFSYNTHQEHPSNLKFAKYGWGLDYHDFVKTYFEKLREFMETKLGLRFDSKIVVDTAPVLEKDFAMLAGLGWIGKNTLLMNQKNGSFLYLGLMLTNLELLQDKPVRSHCGTCTACMDACPTSAIEKPFVLNPKKCITYHTIENKKEDIPQSVQTSLDGWVAGCDICQDVCPWNNKASISTLPEVSAKKHIELNASDIKKMSLEQYRSLFSQTAFSRIGFEKLQHNAKSALKGLDMGHTQGKKGPQR